MPILKVKEINSGRPGGDDHSVTLIPFQKAT